MKRIVTLKEIDDIAAEMAKKHGEPTSYETKADVAEDGWRQARRYADGAFLIVCVRLVRKASEVYVSGTCGHASVTLWETMAFSSDDLTAAYHYEEAMK